MGWGRVVGVFESIFLYGWTVMALCGDLWTRGAGGDPPGGVRGGPGGSGGVLGGSWGVPGFLGILRENTHFLARKAYIYASLPHF